MTTPDVYKHSGRSGALGVPLALVAGLAAACLLGAGYAFAVNWIPFIYINFFVTLGFGFAVGFAAVDNKGNASTSEEPLLKNMCVAHDQLERIRTAGREATDEEKVALGLVEDDSTDDEQPIGDAGNGA